MSTPPPARDSRPPATEADPESAFRSSAAAGTDTVGTVEGQVPHMYDKIALSPE